MQTVEIDLDSLDLTTGTGYGDLVSRALVPLAAENPELRATVWVRQGNSTSFGRYGYSAFFGVAGDQSLLRALENVFRATPQLLVRPSDEILQSQALCQYHVEDGKLWREYEAYTWYSGDAGDAGGGGEEPDEENFPVTGTHDITDDSGAPPKGEVHENLLPVEDDDTWPHNDESADDGSAGNAGEPAHDGSRSAPGEGRSEPAARIRKARSDASLGAIIHTIEAVFGLPEGSVALRGPDRKILRRDATVGTLRKRWE